MKVERSLTPFALRPDDAANTLGISKSALDKLVKEKKIRPPVSIPGLKGVKVFDRDQLWLDWQALREEGENGATNSWDDA
jgi:hypothetical protein